MSPGALAGAAVAIVVAALVERAGAGRPGPLGVDVDAVGRMARRVRSLPASLARRPRIEPMAVATWLDELARALRHGASLSDALGSVRPDDEAVRRASEPLRLALQRGATASAACERWAASLDGDLADERAGAPGTRAARPVGVGPLRSVCTVLTAVAVLGGAAAAPLERAAATMRALASDRLERAAQSAQARLSARILTALPVGVLTLLVTTDADVRRAVTSPAGSAAVGAGLVLAALGAAWMRRVVVAHADGGTGRRS